MRNGTSRAARLTRYSPLVIVLVFVILAGVYSVVTPLFEGPDEIWHFAFANHLANGGGLPVFDAAQPATFLRNGAHPPLYYVLVAALIAPIDRSDFPADFHFNLANPLITRGATGASPSLIIHTAREDWPWRNTALAAHLARWVSIALNALALWGVWLIARRVLRGERLALLALALAAFVPQFVYGAAMINNDALAAASVTWLVYALLRWLDSPASKWAAVSGALLGLVLLSKIGLIALLPVPALAMCLYAMRHTPDARLNWRRLLGQLLMVYGLALIIAGWFYGRNWLLYGDPLAWREWQALTGAGRVPPTVGDFIGDMLGLFGTFWIDFSLRVDRTWWPVFGVIALAAIVGLVRRVIRHEWPLDGAKLLIAVSALVLLLASAVRYSFNIYNIHGRLLYPALAAIAVLLALGLSAWKPRALAIGLSVIPLVFTVISPLAIIQPAYARPIVSALPDGTTKTAVQFGDVALIGYRVGTDRVKAGGSVEIETYWRAGQPTGADRHVVIWLQLPADGSMVGKADALLGTDAYPSSVWQPGEMVVTRIRVPTLAALDASSIARINLGLRGDAAELLPSDHGDEIGLGRVTLAVGRPCTTDRPVSVTYGNQIRLTGYRLDANAITFCWEALQPHEVDYSIFVHVYDGQGQLIGVADAQPRYGDYPTSAWVAGDHIEDTHLFKYFEGGAYVKVGIYRADTGARLPIDDTSEAEFQISLAR